MSDQDGTLSIVLRPTNGDKWAWRQYWQQQGQSWRTEPEIDAERQKHLEEFRSGRNMGFESRRPKLSRADLEWLLATHNNGRGPIDWSDTSQRQLRGLDLDRADLSCQDLSYLPLANMIGSGHGFPVNLKDAKLANAHLEGAMLHEVNLSFSDLHNAHLEGADLTRADLHGANLSGVYFDGETKLNEILLSFKDYLSYKDHYPASLVDIHWGEVNIAVVDWSSLSKLGNEPPTLENEPSFGSEAEVRLNHQLAAMRAYRQLSVVLKNQGLNEDANRFAYRAQLMQRKLLWRQSKFWRYLGSLLLDLITGYGYRPMRSFLAYLIVILTFASTYFIIGHTVGPALSPLGSVIFSMTSFHGRGFFPGGIGLDDPLTVFAALEAFVGLLIEVTFIATLTRRLFGT